MPHAPFDSFCAICGLNHPGLTDGRVDSAVDIVKCVNALARAQHTLPISRQDFRALLNWFMASDPPHMNEQDHHTIEMMLLVLSRKYGFSSWAVAYHEFKP